MTSYSTKFYNGHNASYIGFVGINYRGPLCPATDTQFTLIRTASTFVLDAVKCNHYVYDILMLTNFHVVTPLEYDSLCVIKVS
ncbi:hypothetical protein XENTR_v10005901 [Xenopus tropicalis]|nr:hypothetical protein XENTR_v10005901 [Xenopus tropicalis]